MAETNDRKTEVLIAGAGPAGLMMACQLAMSGVKFRIIDKKTSPSTYSGALIIHAKTLELFRQMGLAEKALELGQKVKVISVRFKNKKPILLKTENTGNSLSNFSSMLMLEQGKTEQLLIEFLSRTGHCVEWNTELVGLRQFENYVLSSLKLSKNEIEFIHSKYLVAADGGQSKVRNILKAPFRGKSHQTPLFIVEYNSGITWEDNEIGFIFTKSATIGIFPLSGGARRIDASVRNLPPNRKRTFSNLKEIIDRETRLNIEIHQPDLFSTFRSHTRVAESFKINHCFLIGDAAHICSPVGAQGMNSALLDAQNLAWKISMVIKHSAKPEMLKTYEQERKPLAQKVTRVTDWFFRLVTANQTAVRFTRLNLLPAILHVFNRLMKISWFENAVFKQISGIGISYQKNYLNKDNQTNIGRNAPKPGERLPVFTFVTDGVKTDIREKVSCTKFHLLIFLKDEGVEELLQTAAKYKSILTTQIILFSDDTKALFADFGLRSNGWYLVRPDTHIACRSDSTGAEEIHNYFRKILNVPQNE